MPDTSLANRVALVTGGLQGIGRATAECLRARGATVIIGDLPVWEAAQVPPDAKLHYQQLDVTSEAAWTRAHQTIAGQFGRLDIMVNNAGGDSAPGTIDNVSIEDWRRLMTLNVDSVFQGIKVMAPLLALSGGTTPAGSSVINVSSILGQVGTASSTAYCTSKGAVRLMTKALALEFASSRTPIRVNSIHPGMVATPLLLSGIALQAVKAGTSPLASQEALAAAVPTGRLAAPEEIGKVIAFLASDDASYMTGSEITVDGGWTAR